jgi:hypothetical protein
MAVGCVGLTAILLFFSYIIFHDFNTIEERNKNGSQDIKVKKIRKLTRAIIKEFASNLSELASNLSYFLVLISMAIFHSISVFSNSYIIEVIFYSFLCT